MESLSICLSSFPPYTIHSKTQKSRSIFFLPNNVSASKPTLTTLSHNPINQLTRISITNNFPILKNHPSLFKIFLKTHLSSLYLGLSLPLSSFAIEATLPTDQVSNKINLEEIVVSIDNFFNRYPFFVAGVTFIWLIVIPLAEDYLQKFKFISAINAFRKLRDDPSVQLLDIRDAKSLRRLSSPILKILDKNVVHVEYCDGDEDGFVKKVLENFEEPASTTICILDNFDDKSMKVAALLFENGFREAYAIRGGVKGKNGWLAIQETLLPPSVHISPKKRGKKLKQAEMNGGVKRQSENPDHSSSVSNSRQTENGYISKSTEPTAQAKKSTRSLSPYPMYPDMKPPSSPTPSEPKS